MGYHMQVLTEHQLVKRISKLCPNRSKELLLSIGDDAAVFSNPSAKGKDLVACQDLLVEKVHFQRETHSAENLGHKSLAVNFSDIAAMGATPLFAMVSLAIPKDIKPDHWIEEFYRGADLISEKFGVTIMGGDLSSSPEHIFIDVSVIGVCHAQPILRSGAQPGDLIGISGPLGLSYVGLRTLQLSLTKNQTLNETQQDKMELNPFLTSVYRHLRPNPRITEAKAIGPYLNALIDISDGLINDLNIILEQSSQKTGLNLIAQLDCNDSLFLHHEIIQFAHQQQNNLNPLDIAFYGGEDFELLFTFHPKHLDKIREALCQPQWMPIGVVSIGNNKDQDKIFYKKNQLYEVVDFNKRWQHF